MNKGLTTNILLFLPIKIIFLNLFYLNVMDFAYGYDLILLQDPNNIDEYEVRFIQSSWKSTKPSITIWQSGAATTTATATTATTATDSNNSNSSNNNYHLVTCNHHNNSSSSRIQQQLPSGNLLGAPQQPPSSESESLSPLSEELQRLLMDIPSQFPDDLLRADPRLLEKELSSSREEEGAVSLNVTEMANEDSYKIKVGKRQFIISVGSLGDDRIIGTAETDVIIGLPGSDNIRGGNGTDVIQGDEDADRLYGEKDNDIIQGGLGSDQIYGGDGDDILTGGLDDDLVLGENGNDKIYGDLGDDVLDWR